MNPIQDCVVKKLGTS